MRSASFIAAVMLVFLPVAVPSAQAAYRFSDFRAHPPIHVHGMAVAAPTGLTPAQIKAAYHLPESGGQGTIAIVGAYDDARIESDLNVFSRQFGLPECTTKNGCFEKIKLGRHLSANAGWALETSLDVEWAHAIAPQAKILLIEAKTPSGANLLAAVDAARTAPDVTAISMSWGGPEFSDETSLDAHFASLTGATFFASSGDDGAGASWPAVSPNVVAVGGTTLRFTAAGSLASETAWGGSGGGVSAYEKAPAYQVAYGLTRAKGMRAVPDVSYDADPSSGVSVYRSSATSRKNWYVLGGTSAGAPQWAAIKALGNSADNEKFYADKAGAAGGSYFRDIVSGKNGDCAYFCDARRRYDFVTGLGSPLRAAF